MEIKNSFKIHRKKCDEYLKNLSETFISTQLAIMVTASLVISAELECI